MSDKSAIEWTDATWSPVTGCDRVSPGCDNCYALGQAKRLKAMGSAKYQTDGDPRTSGPGFGVATHDSALGLPLTWRKPKRIFVNSMSDLFHDSVPDGFIAQVWDVMAQCPQHTFQILTKRHARMRSWVNRWADTASDAEVGEKHRLPPMPRGPQAVRETYTSGRGQLFADMLDSMGTPPPGAAYPLYDWMEGPRWWPRVLSNVWLGVSVEDQKWAEIRIPALLETPAAVRWLSCEPLLGPVNLSSVNLPQWGHHGTHRGIGTPDCPRASHHHHDERCKHPIDWVVVGGESGQGARLMHLHWARSLRDQCVRAGIPFFFKQWGEWCHSDQMPPDTWQDLDARINLGQEQHPEPHRVGKKRAGRLLDERTWDEYPTT